MLDRNEYSHLRDLFSQELLIYALLLFICQVVKPLIEIYRMWLHDFSCDIYTANPSVFKTCDGVSIQASRRNLNAGVETINSGVPVTK